MWAAAPYKKKNQQQQYDDGGNEFGVSGKIGAFTGSTFVE
jgi:hypothetical protein